MNFAIGPDSFAYFFKWAPDSFCCHPDNTCIGTGAEHSDLMVGDVIVAVDGESVLSLEPKAILRRINGPVGTQVLLVLYILNQTSYIVFYKRAILY